MLLLHLSSISYLLSAPIHFHDFQNNFFSAFLPHLCNNPQLSFQYRPPRRYSDYHRDNSAPSVGSSKSTPLHFAAANGYTNVGHTLLLHGAHADRTDKHGVTPEMLARDNGKESTADALREWLENNDKDLRERGDVGDEFGHEKDRKVSSAGALYTLETKRLHV